MTREYSNVFSALYIRGHEIPSQEILQDYKKFREWWNEYRQNPEIGENPYKRYTHGFSVIR